jgi:hypothetical protein
LEDRALVEKGSIALIDLFTIRRGEPAYDNVARVITPAETDIIKINPVSEGDTACRFFIASPSGCGIYEQRPVECRVLQCWNTRPLMQLYQRGRLTRRHLLSGIEGLWDLVRDHQARCDYEHISSMAGSIRAGGDIESAQNELLDMIRFDQKLREATMERTGYDARMLAFLLGRPLVETIRLFRLRLVQESHGPVLEPYI